MLVDTDALEDDSAIEADVCIVGAGPAGLTVAKELAAGGVRVAVLESGGDGVEPEVSALADGEIDGIAVQPLEATRVRALGGTSNVWTGQCRMLDEEDFLPRAWVPDSGWPFRRSELEPYYAKAHRIIRFRPVDYDMAKWSARLGQPCLRPSEKIAFHRVSLCKPVNFWSDYALDLKAARNVTVVTHATVLAIRLTEDEGAVVRLDVGNLRGKRLTARARHYVLACGGLDNARLLLLSDDVQACGVGNRHDVVGRFFMEHPRFISGTLLLAGLGLPARGLYSEYYLGEGQAIRGDLGIVPEVRERERIANVAGRLEAAGKEEYVGGARAAVRLFRHLRQRRLPHDLGDTLWQIITDADEVAAAAYRRFASDQNVSTFTVTTLIEQAPNRESRLTLCERTDAFGQRRPRLVWRFCELDRRTAFRAVELLAQAVGAADIGRIRLEVASEQVFPPSTEWGHHHMGTTRMSDDPRTGVVDRDAKVHGIANLFIAGASVFPTSGSAPPTLTVVALAARLADHLRRRLAAL